MANLSLSLNGNNGSAILSATDLTTSQQIVNRLFGTSFAATALSDLPYLQTINGTLTIVLPAATAFFVYIRNLDTTGDFTINYTPTVGTPGTFVCVRGATAGQGGIFLYTVPTSAGAGGITALSITAAAVLKAEVLIAG